MILLRYTHCACMLGRSKIHGQCQPVPSPFFCEDAPLGSAGIQGGLGLGLGLGLNRSGSETCGTSLGLEKDVWGQGDGLHG